MGTGQRRLRSVLVVAEVAATLVLLVGAGLFGQTLYRMRYADLGLRPERLLTLRTTLPEPKYDEASRRAAFYEEVLERTRSLPGVVSAGYSTSVPLEWKGGTNRFLPEGPVDPRRSYDANHRQVSADYLKAMGIPLRRGRHFERTDGALTQKVAIVNEAMAREYWPGADALGKRFKIGRPSEHEWITIVGIVGDVRQMGLDAPAKAEMYFPYSQIDDQPWFAPRDLVVRSAVEPMSLVPSLKQVVRAVDSEQPVSNIRTFEEILDEEVVQRRLGATLVAAFAGLALLLASLGVYGVLSFFVAQHTAEVGVRLALGASRGDILRLVLGQGMALAVSGVGLGTVLALALTRLVSSLLYGVGAADPLTFAAAAALLTALALLACYGPAQASGPDRPHPRDAERMMDTLLQDLRFAIRGLLKAKTFAAVALLTLGLGIGGSTAIFSAVDAVLLRPLPYSQPERLVAVWTSQPKRGFGRGSSSFPDFEDYRAKTTSFEDLAALRSKGHTLTDGASAERISGGRVSASFFPLLRTGVALGRTFGPDDDRPGAAKVALLSHALWQRRFGASSTIVGQSITLDREPFTVIGVLPASFRFPMDLEEADIFTTMGLEDADSRGERGMHYLAIVGRLKDGTSLEAARADLATLSAGLEQTYPESNQGRLAVAVPLHEEIVGDARGGLLVLLGAVGLVLLLACVNVANLLLARASGRERELAIRGASGATWARIVRQLLTESLVLSGLGGAIGLLLAFWGVGLFVALAPSDLPRLAEVRVDGRVLLFASAVSLLTGLAFGVLPAWRAAQSGPRARPRGRRLCGRRRSGASGSGRAWSWPRWRSPSSCWSEPACSSAASQPS